VPSGGRGEMRGSAAVRQMPTTTRCPSFSARACVPAPIHHSAQASIALRAATEEDRARTTTALSLLAGFTKQRRRMNVVLVSSDYAEPSRLSALGFKSSNFTDTLLVPEVPPKEMRELLEGRWGMSSNLATACMAAWGGEWAARAAAP